MLKCFLQNTLAAYKEWPFPLVFINRIHLLPVTGSSQFHHYSGHYLYRAMDENETPKPDQFTIRVYGILIDAAKGVLVADEIHKGSRYTKFPGGGLEPGEGTVDCLKREWMEELQKPIEIIRHFYTTDFFQRSAFDKKVQVISIYYLVRQPGEAKISISKHPFELNEDAAFGLSFRWIRKAFFQPALFSLPIDKLVAQMILEKKML